MLTRLRAGALPLALSSNSSNSGIPDAARVASGPGEIACTRMPFGPRPAARRATANALRPGLGRDVAHGCLQGGLRYAHDIVILHHHLAAVVGHREKRS